MITSISILFSNYKLKCKDSENFCKSKEKIYIFKWSNYVHFVNLLMR